MHAVWMVIFNMDWHNFGIPQDYLNIRSKFELVQYFPYDKIPAKLKTFPLS